MLIFARLLSGLFLQRPRGTRFRHPVSRYGEPQGRTRGATISALSRSVRFQVSGFAFVVAVATTHAGSSFDTNLSPERARDLLAAPDAPTAPAGSWLRLRDLHNSMVGDNSGGEVPPWSEAKPTATLAERRAALAALRQLGYRLIGFVRWSPKSWPGSVRPGPPTHRLPLDLREATARCRQLAEAYGDLIDYWEIENEPDISFVDENPETYAAFLKACYLGFAQAAASGKGKAGSDATQSAASVGSEPLPLASSPSPPRSRSRPGRTSTRGWQTTGCATRMASTTTIMAMRRTSPACTGSSKRR